MKFPPATKRYIARNRRQFDRLVAITTRTADINRALARCEQVISFAVKHPCGVWYSQPLEAMLQRFALQVPSPIVTPDAAKQQRFLYVFSTTYGIGGHTRVCERWIAASDSSHAHDVVLLNQGSEAIPEELTRVVAEKNGQLLSLQGQDYLTKAAQLRALASGYRAVILFVHHHDVLPMVAFATPECTTPIVFYNHADHLIWLGASLGDVFVNLRTCTTVLDQQLRGIPAALQRVLPLPVRPDLAPATQTRAQILAELGFPADAKVMVSVAWGTKFRTIVGLDFIATIKQILAQDPKAVLLAIGPKPSDPTWARAQQETKGRIHPLGVVPSHQLDRYLRIADIGLESFPMGSTTSLFDVAKHRVPCVALKVPVNPTDTFEQAGIICATPEEYAARAAALLRGEGRDDRLYKLLVRDSFPEGFAAKLQAFNAVIPAQHTHRPAKPIAAHAITEFELVIAENCRVARGSIFRQMKKGLRWRKRFFLKKKR